MNIENFISDAVRRSVEALYGTLDGEQLQIQKTRKEFEGDYTLVTFPLLRRSRKSPEATATEIGGYMTANVPEIKSFNVIKGFLNLVLDGAFWAARFDEVAADADFGQAPATGRTVMIEYSSPNTNKPLHLGHIRNNLLGYSVAQILKANGHNVIKANLVNDRGIHICKSMLAWKLYGNGETPATSGMKGDHLVGKYYVEFDKHYKAQIKELMAQGQSEEEAKKNAPVMLEAQEMLRKWEARDPEVYSLWETMNGWVYEGFDVTYKALGVDFDKVYYESQTYLLGKSLVEEGLRKGVFYRRPDNSVWINLTADGLDEKLLLRDGGFYAQVAFSAAAGQGFEAGGHGVVKQGSAWTKDNQFNGVDFVLPFRFRDSTWQLGTRGPVRLNIAEIQSQVPARDITASLQGSYPWSEASPLVLSDVSASLLGGKIRMQQLRLPQHTAALLRLENISSSELITATNVKQVTLSGAINGALPLWVDNPQWIVHDGWLTSPGPLTLRVDKEMADAMARDNAAAAAAVNWLRYMEISRSWTRLDVDNLGVLRMRSEFQGESHVDGKTSGVRLNYQHQENLFTLWRSLRFGDNLQSWLEQHATLPAARCKATSGKTCEEQP
ncbi:MAG: arginine--tRNA ligase [Alistipes onderdonkii]|nr:arginine--tRNA ligase [Alistipes onderdonkii]